MTDRVAFFLINGRKFIAEDPVDVATLQMEAATEAARLKRLRKERGQHRYWAVLTAVGAFCALVIGCVFYALTDGHWLYHLWVVAWLIGLWASFDQSYRADAISRDIAGSWTNHVYLQRPPE